jgi:NAD+ kinase
LKKEYSVSLERIGILGHPKRPKTQPVGIKIEESLQAKGIETWHFEKWEPDDVRDYIPFSDIVIAIGGDGAMLRAARICAEFSVPVLGLNMGRLGFLTEIATPDNWDKHLDLLLKGEYWIERRMMIKASLQRNDELITSDNALNDVVISGTSAGSMIQMDTYINGHWATTYNCDALIVSTPTGSTAYALAAGGPILPPSLSNILLVPTASHLSMDRPIVLSEGSQVAVRLSRENRGRAFITIDGMKLAQLTKHDILYIEACEYVSRFVRMRERNYFYRSLLDRLEPRVNRSLPEHMKSLKSIIEEKL